MHYITILLMCIGLNNFAQSYTLSGTITTEDSQETLLGVTIYAEGTSLGTVSNNYGVYSLTLPEGAYQIIYQNIGFKTKYNKIILDQSRILDVSLAVQSEELEEVIITGDIESIRMRSPEMSINRLSSKTIKQTPVVFGESDVLKTIQLLPGVTNAGEGASGFNVRGGGADQNLILLDEATIFNSSHLFGFFSVFNSDAIKDIQLYKGGIPATYGGRISSVLRIDQKEGAKDQLRFNGGIGAVSSRALLEGPLGNGSFILAGRGTYAHFFLKAFDQPNLAYFYDINTKITLPIDEKNRLLISGYFGRDVVSFDNTFENSYGNTVVNLRWNRIFSPKIFGNLSLIYSDYYYGLALDFVGFNWDSGIKNFNIKYDLNYNISEKISLETGIQGTYYSFNPGYIQPLTATSGFNSEQLQNKFAAEGSIYLSAKHDISPKLALHYGLRINQFNRLPQSGLLEYTNNQPISYNTTLGIYQQGSAVGFYRKSESKQNYTNIEPRFTVAYHQDQSAWKASYQRVNQYLHLISNTTSPTPLDVWTPSGRYLKPQQSNQWALGYVSDRENGNSMEVEIFYKHTTNRYDYIDGAELVANEAIEQILLPGTARAYGLELLFKKTKGRVTSIAGYTFSRAEQKTPGQLANEPGINKGDWYLSAYDKTHDLSLNMSYTHSNKWKWDTNVILQTGQPITYPLGQYEFMGTRVPSFGQRNGQRLPTYHRIDISATLTPKKQQDKKIKGSWVFSIYNIYNRRNAATVSFKQDPETGKNQAYKLSIFGIIPSLIYNMRF
jgi:hypothetical protein